MISHGFARLFGMGDGRFTGHYAQECVGMEVECKNQHLGCKWATWHVGMAISNGDTCLDRQESEVISSIWKVKTKKSRLETIHFYYFYQLKGAKIRKPILNF